MKLGKQSLIIIKLTMWVTTKNKINYYGIKVTIPTATVAHTFTRYVNERRLIRADTAMFTHFSSLYFIGASL